MYHLSREVFLDDTGATTEEGILMIVLSSFAVMLLLVLHSDPVRDRLAGIVQEAMNFNG